MNTNINTTEKSCGERDSFSPSSSSPSSELGLNQHFTTPFNSPSPPPSSLEDNDLLHVDQDHLDPRDRSLSKSHSPLLTALLVVLVVVNVVGQSTYLRLEFGSLHFTSYFLLTWMGCLFLCFAYPLTLFFFFLHKKFQRFVNPSSSISSPPSPSYLELLRGPNRPPWSSTIAKIVFMAVVNLGSTLLWYYGASSLSEGAQTSVYHIVVVFVYVFSILFLREEPTWLKSLACFTCVAGVALVGISHSTFTGSAGMWCDPSLFSLFLPFPSPFQPPSSLSSSLSSPYKGGYIATLGAALGGATYEVTFRKFLMDSDAASRVPAVQSAMGVVVVCLLPLHFALIPVGIENSFYETFGGDNDSEGVWEIWSFLLGNAAFASTYYLIWGFGMPLTSPLFFTICSLLQIPAGAVLDTLIWGTNPGIWGIVGMVLVCFGVVLLAWPGNYSFEKARSSGSESFLSLFVVGEEEEEEEDP